MRSKRVECGSHNLCVSANLQFMREICIKFSALFSLMPSWLLLFFSISKCNYIVCLIGGFFVCLAHLSKLNLMPKQLHSISLSRSPFNDCVHIYVHYTCLCGRIWIAFEQRINLPTHKKACDWIDVYRQPDKTKSSNMHTQTEKNSKKRISLRFRWLEHTKYAFAFCFVY